jgi:4-aminobutyrate aminotransferase-like enzyme
VGAHALKEMKLLEEKHPFLDCVDGKGLMIGGEIVKSKTTREPAGDEMLDGILRGMLKRGVIIGRGGLFYNRIRFQPPLCITEKEVDRAMEALDSTLTEVERSHGIRQN